MSPLEFRIVLVFPYLCIPSMKLVYQVCYTRYRVSFYLWLIGSVLRHCKLPKFMTKNVDFKLIRCNISLVWEYVNFTESFSLEVLNLMIKC